MELLIIKELIDIANKELNDSRDALFAYKDKLSGQRASRSLESDPKLKTLEAKHKSNLKQLNELLNELYPEENQDGKMERIN